MPNKDIPYLVNIRWYCPSACSCSESDRAANTGYIYHVRYFSVIIPSAIVSGDIVKCPYIPHSL
nr:MAG TPA: hypothetical protein [Caudoviricetes sp.]